MWLMDNLLQAALGVESLASFGNSAFLRLGTFGHHKRMVNFES
jgi:uridine phosphorylase